LQSAYTLERLFLTSMHSIIAEIEAADDDYDARAGAGGGGERGGGVCGRDRWIWAEGDGGERDRSLLTPLRKRLEAGRYSITECLTTHFSKGL